MNILKNTTDGVMPSSELYLVTAGRRTGKSIYNYLMMNPALRSVYATNLCKEIMSPTEQVTSTKPKYQFSRNWYEVHLSFTSWEPIQERLDWCTETFGPQPKNHDSWSRWYTSFTTVRFRDKQDYEWYMLKWS